MKKRLVLALVMMCLILSGCGKSNAVRNAEEKIAAIGTVTADSGAAIADAEAAMDALSAKEREKVENAAELPAARDAWKKAIAEREERERQTRLETLRRELLGSWEFTQEVTDEYAELIDRMIGSMMGFTEIHFSDYVDRIAATGSFTLLGNGTYKIGFTAAQRETFLDSIVTPIKRYYADIMRDLIAQELAFSGIVIDDIHSDEAWVSATGMDFNSHLRAIAARDFGEAHADEVVATWADLSDAIRDNVATSQNQYGPLRLGPAYPFNALGPLLKKGDWPGFTSWMCNPNYGYYIPWGKPFGTVEQPREELDEETHKVEIELFGSAGRRFVAGGEKLRRFANELSGERRLHARREAGVVEYIGRCFLTTSNVKAGAIAERVATDCGRSVSEREAAKRRVGEIARMEYANTRASLDLLRENSHLGSLNIGAMLSTSSEYIGGLERVEWKLRHMEKIYGIDGSQK